MRRSSKVVVTAISAVATALFFQNCSKGFELAAEQGASSDLSSTLLVSGSGKSQVLRISNLEYKNSVTDALTYQFSRQSASSVATTVLTSLKDSFASLPADVATMRLGTVQLAVAQVSTDRFNAFTNISYAVAKAVTSSTANLKAFAGSCVVSNTDLSNSTCVDTFIVNFGTLVFRSPPKAVEIAELKTGLSSWTDLVGRILIHPRFLTHYYRDGSKNSDGSYNLTAYEIEARLASAFWKSIPDVAGLQAAASGSVLTAAGLKTEVLRMLNSTKSKDTLWEFYQEWLGASRLPGSFDTGAAFTTFASPFSMSALNAATFRGAVLQDARDFLEYFTWQTQGSLEDIFRSPNIFTMDATVASIYGVSARTSSTQAPVVDSTGRYKGILTRPIITQQKPGTNGVGNHVQRGVLFMSNLLGYQLGAPANFAEQQGLASSVPANASSMTEVQIKTSPANCMACHSSINPSGFAIAKYDSLGRYSDTEKRYAVGSSGTVSLVAQNTVDATSALNIDGKTYTITGPASFVDALVDSGKLYQGFSKYYFRFIFGRLEDSTMDKGIMDQLYTNLKNGSLQNAFVNLALHPDFVKARPAQ